MKESKQLSNAQRTGILITLLTAAFVSSMSTTVTANMIPNFSAYFGVSASLAQWLTSGATLISGVTIPLTAYMIKRMSNRMYFFAAMTAFTAGSLGALLAPSFLVLLISRMVQAAGCGMLLPFAQVVLLKIYPQDRQGIVLAAYSMAAPWAEARISGPDSECPSGTPISGRCPECFYSAQPGLVRDLRKDMFLYPFHRADQRQAVRRLFLPEQQRA